MAGEFYPDRKEELEEMIEDFFKRVKLPKIKGNIFGLLVPHAGYIFSGIVASYGYKAIFGENFETVILIGDSHYERFSGISIWDEGEWKTPLGFIKIDHEIAKEILNYSSKFVANYSPHIVEHSLEVQLPFLQKTLKDFKIVPILLGSKDSFFKDLAQAILKNINKKKILVVVSSDLSHYPNYEDANEVDKKTISGILTCDPEKFVKTIKELNVSSIENALTFACAEESIKTILEITKNLNGEAKLLKYLNSGDSKYGDKFQVVGYASIVFFLK